MVFALACSLLGIALLGTVTLDGGPTSAPHRDVLAAALVVAVFGAGFQAIAVARAAMLVRKAKEIAAGNYVPVLPTLGDDFILRRLSRALAEIAESFAYTHDRATIDGVTGVANRAALLGALFVETERAVRYERPLSLAMLDIDHFKSVNDTFGHQAGDAALRHVAHTVVSMLPTSSLIGRYGGEEFFVVCTDMAPEDALPLMEAVRLAIESSPTQLDTGELMPLTVSIGLTGGLGPRLRMERLVELADAAMYRAKDAGRNQVVILRDDVAASG